MTSAGFVLVGGASARMGTDKALLPWRGTVLARHLGGVVAEAAGSAVLIGDPARYSGLGYPVFADIYPGCGPLGGIATALALSSADWNAVAGCDMPAISVAVLRRLLALTDGKESDSIVPIGPGGAEPLCAIYHRSCLPKIEKAISERRLKARGVLADLRPRFVEGIDPACFANLNTPADFEAFSQR